MSESAFIERVCEEVAKAFDEYGVSQFDDLYDHFDANQIFIDAYNETMGEFNKLTDEVIDLCNRASTEAERRAAQ